MLFLASCGSYYKLNNQFGVLEGAIVVDKGNQMSSENLNSVKKGINKEVYIYELTNVSSVEKVNSLYTSIKSKLVSRVKTNKKGEFKIKLNEGNYSILIKENNGFYVAELDKYNNLHPVLIKTDGIVFVKIIINYETYY